MTMNKLSLSSLMLWASTVPAFAGGSGADLGFTHQLIEAVKSAIAYVSGLF